jgi:sialate O-acetylesterase
MVIQRNAPIKVSGKAEDGAKILLEFNGHKYHSISKDGNWYVSLPQMPAGGPFEIRITAGASEIRIRNILIGDVWVCSGQSNMEWTVENSYHAGKVLAKASDAQVRHFKVPHFGSDIPSSELSGGEWVVDDLSNTKDFTAVGYFFAKELHKEINVPIGLINTSWGGSRIESWINPDLWKSISGKDKAEESIERAKSRFALGFQNIKNKFPGTTTADRGISGHKLLWTDPNLDETDWIDITVPLDWENQGFEGLDGIGWYRTSFDLSEEEAIKPIELALGKIDDCDRSFVNGIEVGGYCDWESQRVYQIGPSFLKSGKNNITVRVEDGGGGGGIAGEPSMVYIKTKNRTISLSGKWKFRLGAHQNMSFGGMYNKMIHPLHQFPIRGILWYQGESNTSTEEEAYDYRYLFSKLIKSWREQWGQGNFPFLFVQLANFMKTNKSPSESNWAILRESQSYALHFSNTGQAVIIDVGDSASIHPKDKRTVGYRLSLVARKIAYNEDIVFSGPTYKKHEIVGGKVIVTFENVGSGICSKGSSKEKLHHFSIAGEDGLFIWAKAKIINRNKIIVWNEKIKHPKNVRYAWADNPSDANLYNLEGLPASPFRTDNGD